MGYKNRQITSSKTAPPDFTLTGRTLKDLGLLNATKDYVTVGWRGESATVVIGNIERGKYAVGEATEKEIDMLLDLTEKKLDDNWRRKVKNVRIDV